jgi:membrane protein DedA with SNARE-associated domain
MSKPIAVLKTIVSSDLFLPAALLAVYVLFLIIARGAVPTTAELVTNFQGLYQKYGYEIIFAAAFLEGLVLVNLFVPGGAAMALGAIFARTGQTSLPLVILAGCSGAICAYILDFVLGYFGFADILKDLGYKHLLNQAHSKLDKLGKKGLVLSFIHPNVASFAALISGTLNIKIKEFLVIALISTFAWGTIWAVSVYLLGNFILRLFGRYSFLLVLLVVIGLVVVRWKRKKN